MSLKFVEMEGVEPSSKQAAKGLSTCLAFIGCREKAGKKRPYHYRIPFGFRRCTGTLQRLSQHLRCFTRDTAEKGFPGNSTGLITCIKQPLRNCNRCQLLWREN